MIIEKLFKLMINKNMSSAIWTESQSPLLVECLQHTWPCPKKNNSKNKVNVLLNFLTNSWGLIHC